MVDVCRALLWHHSLLPKLRYPVEKLVLRCGLYVGAKEVFKFMPDELDRVQVWALRGVFHQLIPLRSMKACARRLVC